MKQIIYFKCEICEKLSKDREKILQCEASHYGLTVAEKQEWDNLKEECRYAGATVFKTSQLLKIMKKKKFLLMKELKFIQVILQKV